MEHWDIISLMMMQAQQASGPEISSEPANRKTQARIRRFMEAYAMTGDVHAAARSARFTTSRAAVGCAERAASRFRDAAPARDGRSRFSTNAHRNARRKRCVLHGVGGCGAFGPEGATLVQWSRCRSSRFIQTAATLL
jgi:hypothetical protein